MNCIEHLARLRRLSGTPSPIAGSKYGINWQPPRPFQSEGIEWAERINERMMRWPGEEFKKALSGARSELP